MAQTTAGLSFTKAQVWISDDAAISWINISGEGAAVSPSGGERSAGEQNTLDGSLPIVKPGDRAASTLTVRFVYTEEADPKPFEALRIVHESAAAALQVQYSPSGAPAGETFFWFHADGVLTNLTYPGGEAGPGDVIMCEFVVKCDELAKSTASLDVV